MIDQFQVYINRYNLIDEGDKLILALSGGVDSMVLADLLLKLKVEFVVAHCNFHLRGKESDGDEKFVRDYAERNGIQCFVKHYETEKYAAEQGISIEMAARDLRYAWFEQLRQQLGYDKIAVAHHADDQAETFFINLLRGAGLRGLKGMLPQNGVIIRPLLWASREQIRQYAVENQILWREDHTNAESVYLRNKIRNQLLPVFDELKPEARQGLYKSLEYLASENELYRELLKEKLSQIVKRNDEVQSFPTFNSQLSTLENVARHFRDRIAFIHVRDVEGTVEDFTELFHDQGTTDQFSLMRTYRELGLDVPVRGDHVPEMEGDRLLAADCIPGYFTLGRLFANGYLKALLEGTEEKPGN